MAIKVNRAELEKAFIKKRLLSDFEIAKALSVSSTQIWRVLRVPENDNRHSDPGVAFIDGVLHLFGAKSFCKYFYLS